MWLDSLKSRAFGVVSHAHSDHAAWHDETLLTPATAALMRVRRAHRNKLIHEMPFHESKDYLDSRITLIPAGHVLGSAQVYVESEEGSLLYTGDFKLRASRTAELATFLHADVLVMETTFGLPRYRFPEAEEVIAQIVEFCRKAIEEKCVPVLMAYSLGKAQEIIACLADTGLGIVLHPSIFKMTRVYEKFGVAFPSYKQAGTVDLAGQVLICPPHERPRPSEKLRVAMISGWALDRSAVYRYRCDAAFALSDHAGYEDLLKHVENVAPKRVYTTHGFTEEFARDLRERGIEAFALDGVNQLEFRFKG
ncbi:MAG: MBL fold metallo-hydrolase RNA specificity domain-containing protein [Chthoniobacterales bacterium]